MIAIATQLSDCTTAKKTEIQLSIRRMVSRKDSLFPLKTAGDKVQVLFVEDDETFDQSVFKIQKSGAFAEIKVKELFPTGEYVKEEVLSGGFSEALAYEIGRHNSFEEALKSLTTFQLPTNFNHQIKSFTDQSLSGDDILNVLVCHTVPLNEYEIAIREAIKKQVTVSLKTKNELGEGM
jgi:hypothetical protein